ncbi:MAG: cytochrome c oxidase subunit III [Bacteroidetes bacterium]|nr:MAG: cytochrome c oxidase subunit III [Bacteroidota bacterium]
MAGHSAEMHKYSGWGGGVSPLGASYGKVFMWFFLISDALTFSGFLCAYGFMRHKFAGEWPDPAAVFHHFPFLHGKHLPLLYVGFMTFILIMSSVTMVLAVEAGHRMKKQAVLFWLGLTIIGGFGFVGSQAWEWYNFISGNEQGAVRAMHHGDVKTFQFYSDHKTHVIDTTRLVPPGGHEALSVEESGKLKASGKRVYGASLRQNEYGHTLFGDFFFFITGFHGFHVFSGVMINLVIFIMVARGMMQRRGHYEMVEKVGLYWHFVDLVWVFVFTFFYLL